MGHDSTLSIEFEQVPFKEEIKRLEDILTLQFPYDFIDRKAELTPFKYETIFDGLINVDDDWGIPNLGWKGEKDTTSYHINTLNSHLIKPCQVTWQDASRFMLMACFILLQPNIKGVYILSEYNKSNIPCLNFDSLKAYYNRIIEKTPLVTY